MAARIEPDQAMSQALELAREGYPAPNPHVGCVIVRDGIVVGRGYHDHAGGPHAEVNALDQAGELARGADAFVTLEPCNHSGRTGPCSQALIRAGVGRVWCGVPDPNPRAAGGAATLRAAGIEVHLWPDDLVEQARWIARQFLSSKLTVVGKIATTADGYAARLDGTSKWITGEAARAVGFSMRAELGAVLVGRRTLEIDEPSLTARAEGVVNQPTRLVLDPHAKVAADHSFFASGGRRLCLRPELEFDHAIAEATPNAVLDAVRQLGCTGLMIEGGPTTLSNFLPVIDQIEVFRSPDEWGEGQPYLSQEAQNQLACDFRLRKSQRIDRDFWFTYERLGTDG